MIERRTLQEHPPLSVYRDTETGRTWFDHEIFEDAISRSVVSSGAVAHHIEWNRPVAQDVPDIETILARYHDMVLASLDAGDYSFLDD